MGYEFNANTLSEQFRKVENSLGKSPIFVICATSFPFPERASKLLIYA